MVLRPGPSHLTVMPRTKKARLQKWMGSRRVLFSLQLFSKRAVSSVYVVGGPKTRCCQGLVYYFELKGSGAEGKKIRHVFLLDCECRSAKKHLVERNYNFRQIALAASLHIFEHPLHLVFFFFFTKLNFSSKD